MKCLAEKPLHGFAEQYLEVNEFLLLSTDTAGELEEEAEETSSSLADLVSSVTGLRSISILRNCLCFSTIQRVG